MLLDGAQRRWLIGTALAAVIATAAYVPYATGRLNGPSGGSWPGLTFGVVGFALILYHAGFGWGGTLTLALMVLFTIVIASGIYGVILQQFMPRLMMDRLPLE